LIQEKPIDDVTVQEVLDRASVGRATFYLHFRERTATYYGRIVPPDGLERTPVVPIRFFRAAIRWPGRFRRS
jgi:AcrR family transcriptional regulator